MRLREQRDLADSHRTRLLPRLESEAVASSAKAPAHGPSSVPFAGPAVAGGRTTAHTAGAPPLRSRRHHPSPSVPRPGPQLTPDEARRSRRRPTTSAPSRPTTQGPPPPAEPERPTLGSAFVRIPAEKLDCHC